MGYFIVILCAYLLGSSSMAFYLSKWTKKDFRSKGSGNLGASNAMVLLGWGAGVLVAVHDIGKAFLAVLLAKWLFPDLASIGAVAGVACVLGHIFPFYLKFKGGKGLASYIGMMLALDWRVALAVILLLVIVTLVTDYIVLGTVTVVISSPIGLALLASLVPALIICAATVVVLVKHRENYKRILNGTEIGLRVAATGKHRV